MTETERLEPSFADAIAAIEKSSELTASRRTHWCCSLRKIAEALGRPPENIAARWGAVALRINQLHHAQAVPPGRRWRTTSRTPRPRCSGFSRTTVGRRAASHWIRSGRSCGGA